MNKKITLTILCFLVIGSLVSAGLLEYYGRATINANVIQPIEVTGNLVLDITRHSGESIGPVNNLVIKNIGEESRLLTISTLTDEGVYVTYKYKICDLDNEGNAVCQILPLLDLETETLIIDGGRTIELYTSIEFDRLLETGSYIVETIIN